MAGLGFRLENVKSVVGPGNYEVITEISKMISRQLVSIRCNAESSGFRGMWKEICGRQLAILCFNMFQF